MRLQLAGWDQKTPLIDECIAQGFHKALAVSDAQLRGWLSTGTLSTSREGTTDFEDSDFFSNAKDGLPSSGFMFRSGHNEKKTGSVTVKKAPADSTATLIHNEIQNSLFAKLVKQHGTEHVGTEVATGDGTSIDIVVQTPNFCHFYEIKTGESVKACIRQAIPQLLEYAYWHGKNDRIDSLVIVSQLPPTKEANRYLNFLQSEFGIPISYLQHKISK